MRALFSAAFTAAFLLSGPALADEAKPVDPSKPIELTAAQMDTVTAGNLKLPNGHVIFGDPDFDNPAPGIAHPNFATTDGGRRSLTATGTILSATTGHGPSVSGLGNEGPWSATVVSPVISICTNVIPGFPAC